MSHAYLSSASADASSKPSTVSGSELQALVDVIAHGAAARELGEASIVHVFEHVRRSRLGALRLAKTRGGAAASLVEMFELVIRLSEADPNVAHALRNHFLFVERILPYSNQKFDRWLGAIAEGRLFGLGSSELVIQNIGDGNVATILAPSENGYKLNGTKYYSTGSLYSDFIYISAKTPDGANVAVVVPTNRAGIDLRDDWDGIGQRLTASGTTVLTDVHVSADEVFAISETEIKAPYQATFPQLYLTAVIAGILRAVTKDAVALLKGRGRSYYHAVTPTPTEDPLLQQTVGWLSSAAYVAEASVLRAARTLQSAVDTLTTGAPDQERFHEAAAQAAKAKIIIDEIALDAASRLFNVGGASAATRRQNLDRHWRNIRTLSSHNPVSYKARAVGAYEISGIPLPSGAFF